MKKILSLLKHKYTYVFLQQIHIIQGPQRAHQIKQKNKYMLKATEPIFILVGQQTNKMSTPDWDNFKLLKYWVGH